MTDARRVAAVLGLAFAVVLGSSFPASAGFGDTVRIATTLSTQLVAAPGDVSGAVVCTEPDSVFSLSWRLSSTPRVAAYRVTLHHSDGSVTRRDVAASQSSWTTTVPNHRLKQGNSFQASVTTLTDYGWSTQSPLTGSFTC